MTQSLCPVNAAHKMGGISCDECPPALLAAHAVIEALRNVTLCARCHGDGFWVYFESDGSGVEKYNCNCVEVKKAVETYDRVRLINFKGKKR